MVDTGYHSEVGIVLGRYRLLRRIVLLAGFLAWATISLDRSCAVGVGIVLGWHRLLRRRVLPAGFPAWARISLNLPYAAGVGSGYLGSVRISPRQVWTVADTYLSIPKSALCYFQEQRSVAP